MHTYELVVYHTHIYILIIIIIRARNNNTLVASMHNIIHTTSVRLVARSIIYIYIQIQHAYSYLP